MRVFVTQTGRRVAPFDDAPGDVLVGNRPLRDWQEEAFREAGLTRIDAPEAPCLCVPDTLYTTGPALRRFLDGAAGRNAHLVLRTSTFGRQCCHVQPGVTPVDDGWRFEHVRFVSGGPEPSIDVVVDPEEHVVALDVPRALRPNDDPPTISLPRHPVLTVHHWAHVLWANQACAASLARRTPWYVTAWRAVWAIVRARSFNRWAILGKMNRIGRGCDIHPTAVIEGSTLGDGVKVGAFARVLFSTLADGVEVMPGAHVEASTLGTGAAVAQGTHLRLCVLYPEAFAGQAVLQASVLGRRVMLTFASYSLDLNFEREIRVPLDGALWPTGTRFLGAAFGHRARIGADVWLASGRAVPNDAVVLGPEDAVITRLPDHVPAGSVWRNAAGRLVNSSP